jgi:ribonuclease P protein component
MSGQTLSADERIRRRPEYERVYKAGAKAHGRFMTVFVLPNGGARARLGVAATRKIGSSVDRSRAKRLAREIFRRHKTPTGLDIVVVPRREMLDAPFANLEADYNTTVQRSGRSLSTSRSGRSGGHRHHRPTKSI